MGQNLTKFFAGVFAPKVITDILSNQDPKELGLELGKGLKKAIIGQIDEKAYKTVNPVLIAWIDALYVAIRRGLNED